MAPAIFAGFRIAVAHESQLCARLAYGCKWYYGSVLAKNSHYLHRLSLGECQIINILTHEYNHCASQSVPKVLLLKCS